MALKAFFDNASSIAARLKTSVAQILFNGSGILHGFGARLVISVIAFLRDVIPLISYPLLNFKGASGIYSVSFEKINSGVR